MIVFDFPTVIFLLISTALLPVFILFVFRLFKWLNKKEMYYVGRKIAEIKSHKTAK